MELAERIAVITGGSGEIGRSMAKAFLVEDADHTDWALTGCGFRVDSSVSVGQGDC